MNRLSAVGRVYLVTVTALAGLTMCGIGLWCLVDPSSFARVVAFHQHLHFLHDLGAFQLGLGVTLLLALLWADALATALAGFLVANTVHTVNHFVDLHEGGSIGQAWSLGALSLAVAVALLVRLRQLRSLGGPSASGLATRTGVPSSHATTASTVSE
ncbi:hypothetical protein [Mycobacterium sp. 1423905.2]|uniref:hypothetical protein n=1 Tax=Mycobacterium sp. 1423905.2 TaxID=1856859 RepID=UPI001C12B5A2|nr:hypothetical protein [Mycobacterium sp. 1423905.2]